MDTLYMALWWIFAILIVYTYLLYPVMVEVAAMFFKRPVTQDESLAPKVSVVISVHNEEAWIAQKVKNLLSLEYDKDKLEILIGSDGSTDGTNALLSSLQSASVKTFIFEDNRGKPATLNDLVKEASGEVLVFTDARQTFDTLALKMLVRNFADPQVGCVSGEMYFEHGKKNAESERV